MSSYTPCDEEIFLKIVQLYHSLYALYAFRCFNIKVRFISDCYYGERVGYHGNVNTTRSGRTCQPWKSQCPHRHWRIPKDVADAKNESNMFRNPDRSAPNGPWCHTTDRNVRWEYCNV